MKRIEAIIRPIRFEAVKEALNDIGVYGMTITDVRGFGRQQGHTEKYRGSTYTTNLLPKIKLEIVAPDERVDEIVSVIIETAQTGEIGDGKIFISEVEEVIRIRTGERGDAAL
ncbi:MAG: transcriptional regulator [Armatimonadetes bacterium JP3_11]|jgi:nitrogen regulatory protein P-II 1|nr:MAG: transcriptional regulator [Armatimonadetes bacterium CP1_7O]OYT74013.1 MAG: transcriptional regulator [Armatimonadetes bacterium JP3_11]RMH09157.1 MAG: P-II family nitrogen regulator [Armatimonadota bacterium]